MSILSERFLDIDQIQHRFPAEIRQIGFPITLLHNHSHAPQNSVLVYKNDFSAAEYHSLDKIDGFYECSWFLENGKLIAYEFCDQKIQSDEEQIKSRLERLEDLKLNCYGTTNRPIQNVMEFEVENGHLYVPVQECKRTLNEKVSQTATDGKKMNGCFYFCAGVNGAHWRKHS